MLLTHEAAPTTKASHPQARPYYEARCSHPFTAPALIHPHRYLGRLPAHLQVPQVLEEAVEEAATPPAAMPHGPSKLAGVFRRWRSLAPWTTPILCP